MKRQLFRFTFFLLICLTLPLTATAQDGLEDDGPINIPDPNLRAAIEEELSKASGDTITPADIARLTGLTVADADISDLTGLELAINLTELNLWDNNITDISTLAGLINLRVIGLGGNSVTDISVVSGLTNLTSLHLPGNPIADVSVVSGLTSLTYLNLNGTNITSISSLSGLTNLTELFLLDNNITDISALSSLTKLEILWLQDNNISDLSPLVANTGLEGGAEVHVTGNPLNEASLDTHIPALEARDVTVLYDSLIMELDDMELDDMELDDMELDDMELDDAELVYIPDPHLRAAVEYALDAVPGVPITTADMANLTELHAPGANITNLIGLEHATNLTLLDLGVEQEEGFISNSNSISDISPLAGLTNLRELILGGNSISDLSPVAGLTNLTSLSFRDNSISDISPVARLTNLISLFVGSNPIVDISPVAGLTNLTSLSFGSNSISDISPVAELTNLTNLSFGDNSISDISPIARLTNLTSLFVVSNSIVDISPVAELTNLRLLVLPRNSISDISPLAGLTNLTHLFLDNNSISDISAMAELTNLTFLSLNNNSITDLSPLVENMGLGEGDTVWVRVNFLNALSINTHIPALEHGRVEVVFDNIVVRPEDIAQAVDIPDPNLRTAIEDARGKMSGATITVADMLVLTELFAFNANISDLTGLEGATNMEFLFLENNSISDISPLAGLTKLEELGLANNSISDISPLVANTGLGDGDFVDVNANPLSFLSIYTHIPALKSGGVEVIFQPPEPDLLSGHTDGVLSVAFSPDGALASGGRDGTVILWDPITEQPIVMLTAHTASARSVAFSPDGNILASGSHDGTVVLWHTRQPTTLTEHTAGVESIAFSPDGSILASGSHDGTIILWDVATGQPKDTITGQANRVWSLAFSPDGTLAIGRDNGTIILWDVATGQPKDTLIGHTAFVESVAFNRAGSTLASGSGDNTVILWDVATGRIKAVLPGHAAGVNSVAFNPAGTLLASGADDSTVRLWDAVTGQPIITLTGHTSWVRSVAFSPDGATLASGSGDSTVRLWEIGLPSLPEYTLLIPARMSLIHIPLKVTEVGGKAQTIESVSELYDALLDPSGESKVLFLATYDSQTQQWAGYFGPEEKRTPGDKKLTDDTGILANMIASTSVHLTGNPLGTNGTSTITLTPEFNVVGLPLRDSGINHVSDLLTLDGIKDNVNAIIFTDKGDWKLVTQAGDPSDIPIVGGQAFMLYARREDTVTISGEGWDNTATMAAAPPVDLHSPLTGIQVTDTTSVLGLKGSIVDEGTGLNKGGFRVTVKNLSTGKAVTAVTGLDKMDYRHIIVDIETKRAATVGDILEISAQSPNPFIGVEPLRYTVTAEDVKRSLIELPELVAYEIPRETELLTNYPNPFNPETWIPYRLAEDAFVTLTIYDLNGQVVRTIDVGHRTAAVYENRSKAIYWDGRNGLGEQVASGVYFYHLSAGDFSATRKMVILK